MKNFILFVSILLMSHTIQAQKYKITLNEIDSFTKKHIYEVELNPVGEISNGFRPDLIFGINGEEFYLKVKIAAVGSIHVRKDDPLFFKFENDGFLKFVTNKSYFFVKAVEFSHATLKPIYKIDYLTLKKFASYKLKQLRIYYNDTYATFGLNEKESEEVKKMATELLRLSKSENDLLGK